MTLPACSPCSVCGFSDARALVEVGLGEGPPVIRVILCGSHAVMYARQGVPARSVAMLRAQLQERRGRGQRRQTGDELGEALQAAFSRDKRAGDRRAG